MAVGVILNIFYPNPLIIRKHMVQPSSVHVGIHLSSFTLP